MGMPSPVEHQRMLRALSAHALDLLRRDAREAASLIASHLPPQEQALILDRAKV